MENLLCDLEADICLPSPVFKTVTSTKQAHTLSDCIKKINYANLTNNILSEYKNEDANDILLNSKTLEIAQILAQAIDKNSVSEVKRIKFEYGTTKEFSDAKKILNQQCKQLWNPYKFKNKTLSIPTEAMKALGISNQPSLSSLLEHSVKYFESDGGNTTASVIVSVLNNKNMNYTMEEIHQYLKQMNKKENCKYNQNTIKYLITEQNYTKQKLSDIGIDEISIQKAIKSLGLKNKFVYYYSNLRQHF